MGWNHGLGAWIGATVAGIVGLAAFMAYMAVASGQSVYETQDTYLHASNTTQLLCITPGTLIDCTNVAAHPLADLNVVNMQALVIDVDVTDADSLAAYFQLSCQSSAQPSVGGAQLRDLPVITQTDANGVSYLEKDVRRWYGAGYTHPGTSHFTATFANVPAPWLTCTLSCGAGGTSAVKLRACARGRTP